MALILGIQAQYSGFGWGTHIQYSDLGIRFGIRLCIQDWVYRLADKYKALTYYSHSGYSGSCIHIQAFRFGIQAWVYSKSV